MKVVVTGGAGFLGSHLVDALIERGDEVIVIDHYKRDKLRFENPLAKVHKISFGHAQIAEIFATEKPDAVVHLAAQISVTSSIADPIHDARHNIIESLNLLSVAAKNGCRRFIFVSSGGAIYGDHPIRPTPLLDDAFPLSPYGVAKFTVEHYLSSFREHHGLTSLTLRFSNFYGPRQQLKATGEGNVMATYMGRILQGEPLVIFGDGSTTRDYVFVSDAVRAITLAVDSTATGIVNVGTGVGITVQTVYDTLVEIHGSQHPLTYEPTRKGEVIHSVIDASSAKSVLGWESKVSFAEGMKEMYDWFMKTFK